MVRATTRTSGPKCWTPMRSRCFSARGSLAGRWGCGFGMGYWRAGTARTRRSCIAGSWGGTRIRTRCWSGRGCWPVMTLVDFFRGFEDLPDEFLVYDDGVRSRSYSYREVAERAWAFAARLRESGIGKDEKVILYGQNRPEWIVAFWGCLLEGVVAVPIDYRSSPEFVQRIEGIVQARAIFTGEE